MSDYTALLSPLAVTHADGSQTTLRCRVLMGSMHTGLEQQPDGTGRMAAFDAERARGGVALMVPGGLLLDAEGNMWAGMRTMASPADAAPRRAITDAVHAHAALVALQLLHAGRYAHHAGGVASTARPLGKRLGKATGWIRRALLGRRGVHRCAGVRYERIERGADALALHRLVRGEPRALVADTIVLCAGQEPENAVIPALQASAVPAAAIGGARFAAELDATRAIDEGVRLPAPL